MSRIYHPIKSGEIRKTEYPYNVAIYMADYLDYYDNDDLERIYYPGLIYVIEKYITDPKRIKAFGLYFKEKKKFKEIGEEMNLSSSRISHFIHECVFKIYKHKELLEQKLKEYSDHLHNSTYGLDIPPFIDKLSISNEAKSILIKEGLKNFEDLDGVTLNQLCDLKGMKPKILSEIVNGLKECGIYINI